MRRVHIQQHDTSDCAAACLAMVSASHGRDISITQLRDVMGTGLRGTSLRGLLRAADELGLEAKAARVDAAALRSRYSLPAIAQVLNANGDSHFVVIHRRRRASLLIGDPALRSARWVTINAFLESFTGVLVLMMASSGFVRARTRTSPTTARFVELLLPQRGLFAWAIASSLILTILGIAGSFVTKILFDEVLHYDLAQLIAPLFALFVGLALVQHLVQFVRQWIILHLSQRIDLPLILGYFRHVYSLPISFFASRSVGDILTRFGDALTIKEVFTGAALTVVMDVVMALITGIVLFSMDRTLFLIIAAFVVVSIVIVLIFRVPFRDVNRAQMQQASVLNGRIIEGLRGIEGIKLDANEAREMEGIEREYVTSLRISYREGMLGNGHSSIGSLAQTLAGLVVLMLGTSRVLAGDLSVGTLLAFVSLSTFFIDPVIRLVGLQLSWQEAGLALRRIGEILESDPEPSETVESASIAPRVTSVSFEAVSFSYSMREPALDDVTFSIEEGSKVAFVGPSGSGKSTIAKLILRMYPVENGRIALGGVDSREVSPASLRRAVAYVPQSVHLYSRSITENVRLSRPDAGEAQVRRALELAHATDFVSRLPHRAHTVL